jgi:hypothetical protein
MEFRCEPKPAADGLACSDCPISDCPTGQGQDNLPLSGRRLVLASTGLFLSPCVLAIAGAAWFCGNEGAQFCGALAGLGVGMAAAAFAARRLGRAETAESTKTSE